MSSYLHDVSRTLRVSKIIRIVGCLQHALSLMQDSSVLKDNVQIDSSIAKQNPLIANTKDK